MKPKNNIFTKAYQNRLAWNEESDQFIKEAPDAISHALEETKGFAEFNNFVKHYIDIEPRTPGWLQLRFGRRLLGRPAPAGHAASEVGPTLVYSRGPTGEMVVTMYPIKSEVASVPEDSLVLKIGYFGQWELYHGIRRDIKDLIAYAYVTSIDLKPTLGQKLRIGWLRFASRQHVGGKHQFSPLRAAAWSIVKMAGAGSFSGIFRFLAPATLGWLLGRYGTEWFTSWFK